MHVVAGDANLVTYADDLFMAELMLAASGTAVVRGMDNVHIVTWAVASAVSTCTR